MGPFIKGWTELETRRYNISLLRQLQDAQHGLIFFILVWKKMHNCRILFIFSWMFHGGDVNCSPWMRKTFLKYWSPEFLELKFSSIKSTQSSAPASTHRDLRAQNIVAVMRTRVERAKMVVDVLGNWPTSSLISDSVLWTDNFGKTAYQNQLLTSSVQHLFRSDENTTFLCYL